MQQAEHLSEPSGSIAPLRDFVEALTRLIEQPLAEAELLAQAQPLLATLIARDDWLPPALAEPHPQFYRQYLLHADPLGRFSVVSFVWGPGQATPVHDHTVWGLIGMLRGEEVAQPHALDAQGVAHPHGPATRLRPGEIEAVSPTLGDLHRVSNAYADRTSISIHVYGANIGTVQRWVYPPEGGRKPFVSDYSEPALPRLSSEAVREALRQRREIALIDVREEDPFAQEHPLFAAQLSLSRLELDAPWRLPRREVPLVVYDDGEGLAALAARRLQSLGYTQVTLLDGGLAGWRRSGGELFRDVNVPSKAFGELVEHERGTPSLAAEDVKALLDRGEDVVVLDARRFDEYQTMSIPSGISVPGAELALRVRDLAPNPATRVIVNCAGRTRSIIGTQSLVNAGIPNPVSALRNGTIGWTLAGFALDRGQQRRFGPASTAAHTAAREAAQALATRAGAERLTPAALASLTADAGRTVYRYDVRTPEEYAAGHLPGFGSAPGGQLVQETDMFAPVRGARIVLADIDGVRAPMTAHWLAQLGWDVAWVDGAAPELFTDTSPWPPAVEAPPVDTLTAGELAEALGAGRVAVLDFTTSASHVQRHIPGAWWMLRSQLSAALAHLAAQAPAPQRLVLTCGSSALARLVVADVRALTDTPVQVLAGGNAAWFAAGLPVESGEQQLASPRIDRYRRPYEGTDNPREAMQGYLDWEYGLVAQLGRDGTHGFRVLEAG